MTWNEKEDLRKSFSIINSIMSMEDYSYEKRLKFAEPFKRKAREELKRLNNRVDYIHYPTEDGESCWWKEYFDYTFTEEEKQEFIEDRWVHIYSPYDCTGKWFTSHIAVCNLNGSKNGKAVAYFFMGLDV